MKQSIKQSINQSITTLLLSILLVSIVFLQITQSTPTSTPYYLDSAQDSYSYLVFGEDSTYYAKNGSTGQIDFQSTNASYVVNSALDSLTVGRTWQETVVLKGDITVDYPILVPSWTNVLIQGSVSAGDDMDAVFKFSESSASTHITIEGQGEDFIDGGHGLGYTAQGVNFTDSGSPPLYCANFIVVKNISFRNCTNSIKLKYCNQAWLENFRVFDDYGVAIDLELCADFYIDGHGGVNSADCNLLLSSSNFGIIDGFYAGGWNGIGTYDGQIAFLSSHNNIVSNMRIIDCNSTALKLANSYSNSFTNLHIKRPWASTWCAIFCEGAGTYNNTFCNFQIEKFDGSFNWNYGIYEDGADYNHYVLGLIWDCVTPITLGGNSTQAEIYT